MIARFFQVQGGNSLRKGKGDITSPLLCLGLEVKGHPSPYTGQTFSWPLHPHTVPGNSWAICFPKVQSWLRACPHSSSTQLQNPQRALTQWHSCILYMPGMKSPLEKKKRSESDNTYARWTESPPRVRCFTGSGTHAEAPVVEGPPGGGLWWRSTLGRSAPAPPVLKRHSGKACFRETPQRGILDTEKLHLFTSGRKITTQPVQTCVLFPPPRPKFLSLKNG